MSNEIDIYCVKCEYCGKEICGINRKHAEYNLMVHKKFCVLKKKK